MDLTEYLQNVLKDEQYIEWVNDGLSDRLLPGKSNIDERLLDEIIFKLNSRKERDCFWESILDFLSPESFNSVFEYLVDEDIAVCKMGHMDLEDDKLEILSGYVEEALFTLAKRIYKGKQYSVDEFCDLLKKHDTGVILDQLLLVIPNNDEKKKALYYFYSQKEEYGSKIIELINVEKLIVTENIDEIQKAFESKNYLFYLAISKNLFTPSDILEELSKIKGMKFASEIRTNSQNTKRIKDNFISINEYKIKVLSIGSYDEKGIFTDAQWEPFMGNMGRSCDGVRIQVKSNYQEISNELSKYSDISEEDLSIKESNLVQLFIRSKEEEFWYALSKCKFGSDSGIIHLEFLKKEKCIAKLKVEPHNNLVLLKLLGNIQRRIQ